MTALTWQALLFLTVAYFAGCCLGCILRRTFRRRHVEATPAIAQVTPQIAVQPVVVARTHIAEAPLERSTTAAVPSPVSREPFRRADTMLPAVAAVAERPMAKLSGDAGKDVPRFERALSGEGHPVDPQATAVAAAATSVAEVEAKAAPVVEPDDLKCIHLIDAALEARLNALGVRRFAEIVHWTAPDVARISRELGFKGRIQNENWIEQAQVLAKGGETYYARRLARGETIAARVIEDEGNPPAAVAVREMANVAFAGNPDVADRSAFTRETAHAAEQTPQPEDKPAPVDRDAAAPARSLPVGMARHNLQRIRGINAEVEDIVSLQGVTRYAQISSWSKADVERFDRLLGQDGRIARENWIEQAQILAKGGDTTYSRELDRQGEVADEDTTPAPEDTPDVRDDGPDEARPVRTTDISSLRSVRSQALRASDKPPAGQRDTGSPRAGRIGIAGNLKRIRGIGVLIEKRLHSLGITSYEHIANWTAADIDRISQTLDFKGRIERENWVEQARILAAGGQTEFSRRFDRSSGGSA